MARTRLQVAATTAQISATSRTRQASVQDRPVRSRKPARSVLGFNFQTDRVNNGTSTRHGVLRRARPRHNSTSTSDGTTTRIIISRARKPSSSGNSETITTSDSDSGESHRVSQDTNASGSCNPASSYRPRFKQLSKKSDSRDKIRPSSTAQKTICRKLRPKIVISDSFIEFYVPHGTRDVRIVMEEHSPCSTSSRSVRVQHVQKKRRPERQSFDTVGADRVVQIHRSVPRLSPRSLRKARLRALDSIRKESSSSSASSRSLLGGDRRGSALLPRQHYCEPDIYAHYDAVRPQRNVTRQYTRRGNSPDPGSPPGSGSISPNQERRKVSHKPHYRIANMGVADILRAVTDQSSSLRLIPASTVHELDLDDTTRSQFTGIMKPRHGTSVTGSGPWGRIETCRNRLDWHRWCHLYKASEDEKHDEVLSPHDSQIRFNGHEINERPLRDDVVLVPLTSSQTALLREQLQALDKEDYR